LILVANDPLPRPIVCQQLFDLNTVAVGDKFGNSSVLQRLPRGAATETMDMTGQRALWEGYILHHHHWIIEKNCYQTGNVMSSPYSILVRLSRVV